jgi:hypothetical protein
MRFVDGEETGEKCPDCGHSLYFEMSFEDAFSYKTGHYTVDRPLIVCNKCDFEDDYEDEGELEYDEKQEVNNNGKERPED